MAEKSDFSNVRLEDTLDYSQIIFDQIKKIGSSAENSNVMFYIRDIEHLDDLMSVFWKSDEKYSKWMDEADKKRETEFKKAEKEQNPDKREKIINGANYNYARDRFKILLNLVLKAGFLPHKEVEGVIDSESEEEDLKPLTEMIKEEDEENKRMNEMEGKNV